MNRTSVMKTRTSIAWLAVSLMVMLSLLLASCKPEAEPQGETPIATARPVRLSLGWTPNLDPAIGADESASIAFVNMYDTLVFPKLDGTVAPCLAERWEVSSDGLVYDFALRKDVKFHNGDPLTADDVVFSMERLLTINQGFSYLFKGKVDRVEALDDYTVRFTLTEPFGPFLLTLPRLYVVNKAQVLEHVDPSGPYGEFGDYGSGWFIAGNDAGSGPYKAKQLNPGEYFEAEQHPEYWGGLDPNNPTEFRILGTNESVTVRTLMSRRELEITDCFQPPEVLEALDNIEGIDIAVNRGRGITNLTLNTKKAPTDDVHVRRALAYAIDYDAITTTICPGFPKARSLVFSALAGYKPNTQEYTYDLDKALEELKKSKYYGQLDQYPIEIAYPSGIADREKMALLVQSEAAKIGLTVEVTSVPWVTMTEMAAKPETTPHGCIIGYGADYAEAGSLLDIRFHSRGAGTWMQTDWLQDSEIDTAIDDALRTVDVEERLRKYEQLQERLAEICPAIPLIEELGKQAYQAAYLEWDVAEAGKAGRAHSPLMGYTWVMRDIKVYPDRIPQ